MAFPYPLSISYGDIEVGMHIRMVVESPDATPVQIESSDWVGSFDDDGHPVSALLGVAAPDPSNFPEWTITYELLDEPGSTSPPTPPPVGAVVIDTAGNAYQRVGDAEDDEWITVGTSQVFGFRELGDVALLT